MKIFSGMKLLQCRAGMRWSRMRLCREIEDMVGPHAIQRYELGKALPTANTLAAIAHALNINIEDLFDAAGAEER